MKIFLVIISCFMIFSLYSLRNPFCFEENSASQKTSDEQSSTASASKTVHENQWHIIQKDNKQCIVQDEEGKLRTICLEHDSENSDK